MTVSVILPTFRRPDGLRLALESLLGQRRMPDEIVIVDNAPEGGAKAAAATARAVARCDVLYVHEPCAGVSNARNAGWAAASGRHIAFLDDDEIASPVWLESLLATAQALEATVVFGPLRGEADGLSGLRGALARRLYSRVGPDEDTILDAPFGCGSSLIDRDAFAIVAPPFDPRLNASGGEDDAFFAQLEQQGARFAWSAAAHGLETVGPARTTWRYLLARAFAFGQGATQNCARAERTDPAGIAFWMSVGLAQALVYGVLTMPAWLTGPERGAVCLDKAVQGIGKLFWTEWFEPQFYGDAAPV